MSSEARARAAEWKARGHAWEAPGTPAACSEALRCYAEGLAFFRDAPLAAEAVRLEHGILWMNRGNALQRRNEPGDLAEAVRAYDEAIALLPGDAGAVAQNALGAAWLNRGRALQALGRPADLAEALRSQEQAATLLRPLAGGDDPHFQLNLAGACLNRATLLAGRGQLAEAADAVDEGLGLARRGERRLLRPVLARLFAFGVRLCALHQPQFLAEFVRENLDPADPESLAAARAAVGRVRAELRRPRLLSVDDPASHRLLEVWRDLASVLPDHRAVDLR